MPPIGDDAFLFDAETALREVEVKLAQYREAVKEKDTRTTTRAQYLIHVAEHLHELLFQSMGGRPEKPPA